MPLNSEEVKHLQDHLSDVSDMPETQQTIEWIGEIYSGTREHQSSKKSVDAMLAASAALSDNSLIYALTDSRDEDGQEWEVSFNFLVKLRHHTICTSVYLDTELSRSRVDSKEIAFHDEADREEMFNQKEAGRASFEQAMDYVSAKAMLRYLTKTT